MQEARGRQSSPGARHHGVHGPSSCLSAPPSLVCGFLLSGLRLYYSHIPGRKKGKVERQKAFASWVCPFCWENNWFPGCHIFIVTVQWFLCPRLEGKGPYWCCSFVLPVPAAGIGIQKALNPCMEWVRGQWVLLYWASVFWCQDPGLEAGKHGLLSWSHGQELKPPWLQSPLVCAYVCMCVRER